MPLIDMFEAIDNPEGYISRQARSGPDNTEALRDIYATGALGGPQPHVREGRGTIGSLLQSVGILGQPESRNLTPYEQYLYTKGAQEKQTTETANETHQFNLEHAKEAAKSGSLKDILAYVHTTRSLPDDLLADHPEYRDDAENYLKIVNKTAAEDEAEKNLTRRIRQKQLYTMGNPRGTPKDPYDVYGVRWGRWRAGNQPTIDMFKTRVGQYMRMTDPEQKRIMGQTLEQMQQGMVNGAAGMGVPPEFTLKQLGMEMQQQPSGLGDMSVFPEKNPDPERKVGTMDEVQRQTDMIVNRSNRRP